MSITSFEFMLFVAVSLVIYWNLPKRFQWVLLLVDSLLFYFANATAYTFLYVAFSIISVYAATTYFAKVGMEPEQAGKKRAVLTVTVIANAGILALLKYTNLFIHTANIFRRAADASEFQTVNWLAPLAISFYTLQLLSYLLDCYWGVATVEKNPLKVALYTCYFPQMISGPISRYSEIGTQLYEHHGFDYKRVTFGMKRVCWGLVKKLAISNRLGVIVDLMYKDPATFDGAWIWVATVGFVLQLYTDFSGCMDIVLGVSQCFGIMLPENFNAAFFTRSVQEFWRNWHSTLGNWLRDYIMNPLLKSKAFQNFGKWSKKKFGKKRGKKIPAYGAMLVVWLTMGLWHGNSWKYIMGEGFWFWLVIVSGQLLEPCFAKIKTFLHIKEENGVWRAFQMVRTFVIFTIGMLFFRAASFMNALELFVKGLRFTLDTSALAVFGTSNFSSGIGGKAGVAIMIAAFVLLVIVDYCHYKGKDVQQMVAKQNIVVRWILYIMLIFFVLMSMDVGSAEFAYAQF